MIILFDVLIRSIVFFFIFLTLLWDLLYLPLKVLVYLPSYYLLYVQSRAFFH